MIFIVCILALMAATLTVFDNSAVIFVCCAVGSVCGGWMLYAVLARSSRLRLTWVLAATLLIGYCFGAFVTEVSSLLAGQDPMTYLGLDRAWAAYALVLVMLASIVLLLAGWVETPMVQEQHIVQVSGRQERFLWISVAVVTAAYLHGSVSYGGDISQNGNVSIFGDIIFTLVPLLPAMASVGVAQASGRRRLRFMVLAAVAFLAVLPFGRRQLLYALIITFIGVARLSGRTWNLSSRRKVLLTVASVFVVIVSSFVFYSLRLAAGSTSEGRHSIANILEAAGRTTFKDPGQVAAKLAANVEERTAFLIRYLAWLGRGGNTPSPLYGQDAALSVHMATPSILFRAVGLSKQEERGVATEEILANEHFGLTDTDDANSVLTGGIIDFGLAGVLTYPLIFCAVARLVLFLTDELVNREGRVLALVAILFLYLQTEAPIALYLIGLRNLVIILFCWAILYRLPTVRGRSHPVRALSSRWAERRV